MQLSLLASAAAFWGALRRVSSPTAILLLLAMMVQMGLLGALITFAGAPLYAPHYATTMVWGLTPLEDQQLAGLIMWAPAAAFYLGAALWRGWPMLGPPSGARACSRRSRPGPPATPPTGVDRKRVGWGKSVLGGVDRG